MDEYQDCSARQHRLVRALAAELPCHVLGDPLQCIFDFNGEHPDWHFEVLSAFRVVRELDVPYRWVNAEQSDFGQWILDARADLLRGAQIDLRAAPPAVRWQRLAPDPAQRAREQAAIVAGVRTQAGSGLLIVGDSRPVKNRVDFARINPGVQVIESVELADLITAAGEIGAATHVQRLNAVLGFASKVMVGVVGPLTERVNGLRRGGAKAEAALIERICLRFFEGGELADVSQLLDGLRHAPGVHVYRPHLLAVMLAALSRTQARGIGLREAAIAEREAHRVKGRPLPGRGIGSTLLLKGLESEHAVVLNADPMNAQNLYVALSRAFTSLTVFSSSSLVP